VFVWFVSFWVAETFACAHPAAYEGYPTIADYGLSIAVSENPQSEI